MPQMSGNYLGTNMTLNWYKGLPGTVNAVLSLDWSSKVSWQKASFRTRLVMYCDFGRRLKIRLTCGRWYASVFVWLLTFLTIKTNTYLPWLHDHHNWRRPRTLRFLYDAHFQHPVNLSVHELFNSGFLTTGLAISTFLGKIWKAIQ